MRREDLDADATAWAMGQILSGSATDAQLAGFVVALRAKGETVSEVEALVERCGRTPPGSRSAAGPWTW